MTLLLFSGLSLATTRETYRDEFRFEIVEVSGSSAYFSILDSGDCYDIDENCTVRVTRPSNESTPNSPEEWEDKFDNDVCPAVETVLNFWGEGDQNFAFENCWSEMKYEVTWPIIDLGRRYKFDITPHCDDNDDECAVELQICYNPEDCDPGDQTGKDRDVASSRIGEFWEDAGSCLYDDDRDDIWECINDEFQDLLNDDLSNYADYDRFVDELEDNEGRLGIATDKDDDYDDDLNDVGTSNGSDDDDDDSQTSAAAYQRRWRTARVTPIFEDEDEVEASGYSFRPSRDEYLTVDFTSYLDLSGSAQVCNTNIGCFNLVGISTFFRQYLTNFYVQITDRKIINCMDNRGYDVDDDHAIRLNNPDLIFCDKRVAEAVNLCPRENIGADFILYEMYSSGLLTGILSDSAANSMRTSLEAARVLAPQCLCAAGFNESQMIISDRESPDPWFSTTARRPTDVCD